MKICVTCGLPKEEEEFNWRYKALGIRQKSCRECQHGHQANFYQRHQEEDKERTRRRKVKLREEARAYIQSYKETHPCVDCGESDPRVLDFDHIRGKVANIPTLVAAGATPDRIQLEVSLCVVRCANCHRKKTHAERKRW